MTCPQAAPYVVRSVPRTAAIWGIGEESARRRAGDRLQGAMGCSLATRVSAARDLLLPCAVEGWRCGRGWSASLPFPQEHWVDGRNVIGHRSRSRAGQHWRGAPISNAPAIDLEGFKPATQRSIDQCIWSRLAGRFDLIAECRAPLPCIGTPDFQNTSTYPINT